MLILQEVANEGDEAFVEVATEWCIAFGVSLRFFPRTSFADWSNRKLLRMSVLASWLSKVLFLPPLFAI